MAKYIRTNYARLPIFYGDDGRRVKTIYVSNIREGVSYSVKLKSLYLFHKVRFCHFC